MFQSSVTKVESKGAPIDSLPLNRTHSDERL
jgi:hypothetical protein